MSVHRDLFCSRAGDMHAVFQFKFAVVQGSRAECLVISCPALNTCVKKHKHFLLAMLYDYLFYEVSG